jgi:hypothetical protein
VVVGSGHAPEMEVVVLVARSQLGAPLLREAIAVAGACGAAGVGEPVFLTRTPSGQLRVAEYHDGSQGTAFGPLLVAFSEAAGCREETLVGNAVDGGRLAAVLAVRPGGWPQRASRAVRRLGVTVLRVRLTTEAVADILAGPT